jgi:hypothetical protein
MHQRCKIAKAASRLDLNFCFKISGRQELLKVHHNRDKIFVPSYFFYSFNLMHQRCKSNSIGQRPMIICKAINCPEGAKANSPFS